MPLSHIPHIRKGTPNHNIFKCSFGTLITEWREEEQNNNTRTAKETRRYRVLIGANWPPAFKSPHRPWYDTLSFNLWSIFHPKCVPWSLTLALDFNFVQYPSHATNTLQLKVIIFRYHRFGLIKLFFQRHHVTESGRMAWKESHRYLVFLDDQLVKYKFFSLTHHSRYILFICF